MGKVFFLAKLVSNDSYETGNMQLSFDLSKTNPDESVVNINTSYFKYISDVIIGENKYKKYDCRFPTKYKVSELTYSLGAEVKEFTTIHNFAAYSLVNTDIVFFDINTRLGNQYIKHINNESRQNIFEDVKIDLAAVEAKVNNVLASSFQTGESRIRGQMLYGYDIKNEPDYVKLKKRATQSSLTFELFHPQLNLIVSPLVSKKHSIYIVEHISKDIALEVSRFIYFNYLI